MWLGNGRSDPLERLRSTRLFYEIAYRNHGCDAESARDDEAGTMPLPQGKGGIPTVSVGNDRSARVF